MRSYDQYCGVARAADVLTERWSLLVIRDLLISPMRFTDLREALGAPSNILTSRLHDLEECGVVERRAEPAPGRGVRYHLTDYGRDLKPIVDAIGLWGARRMDAPRDGEKVSDPSLASALRVGWTGHARQRRTWQVRAAGAAAWASIGPDEFVCGAGEAPSDPHLTLGGPGLRRLLARRLAPEQAVTSGAVEITPGGPPGLHLLSEFAEAFLVPLDDLDDA